MFLFVKTAFFNFSRVVDKTLFNSSHTFFFLLLFFFYFSSTHLVRWYLEAMAKKERKDPPPKKKKKKKKNGGGGGGGEGEGHVPIIYVGLYILLLTILIIYVLCVYKWLCPPPTHTTTRQKVTNFHIVCLPLWKFRDFVFRKKINILRSPPILDFVFLLAFVEWSEPNACPRLFFPSLCFAFGIWYT